MTIKRRIASDIPEDKANRFICRYNRYNSRTNKFETDLIFKRNEKSLWDITKDFLKTIKTGKKFKRKELLEYVYGTSSISSSQVAVDSYRNALEAVGFIQTTKRGQYRKLYPIPDNLSITKLQNAFKDKSWKGWFVPLHERLGIKEHECPKKSLE